MNTLQSISSKPEPSLRHEVHQPMMIRFFAYLFSILFHPLFIPLYAVYYLAFLHPDYFNGITEREKTWVILRVGVNIVFFPLISVFLLKGIGFIDSIFLKTQKERIIPYVISNIFFFWMYLVFRNQSEIPSILTSFVFSVFLSSSVAVLANVYFKISMHAIGAGGLLGLMVVILYNNASSPITLPFALTLLITGIVCTSRMIVSNHTQRDIYLGLLCGIVCQLVGAAFIL
ncbi:MAG: hypothetical protein ABIN97_20240 [Ginsengibacter sp.]